MRLGEKKGENSIIIVLVMGFLNENGSIRISQSADYTEILLLKIK